MAMAVTMNVTRIEKVMFIAVDFPGIVVGLVLHTTTESISRLVTPSDAGSCNVLFLISVSSRCIKDRGVPTKYDSTPNSFILRLRNCVHILLYTHQDSYLLY